MQLFSQRSQVLYRYEGLSKRGWASLQIRRPLKKRLGSQIETESCTGRPGLWQKEPSIHATEIVVFKNSGLSHWRNSFSLKCWTSKRAAGPLKGKLSSQREAGLLLHLLIETLFRIKISRSFGPLWTLLGLAVHCAIPHTNASHTSPSSVYAVSAPAACSCPSPSLPCSCPSPLLASCSPPPGKYTH